MDLTDPQQIHGYSYGNNNPATYSDPGGLRPDGPAGGAGYNDDAANREQGRQGSGWVLDNSGGWTYRHERYWPNPGGSRKSARTLDYTWSWRAQSKGAKSRGPWITVLGEDEKPGFFERLFTSAATFYGEVTNVAPAFDCATGDASRCTDFASGKTQALKALGRAIKGTSKGPECHSFLPGTDVLLADGSTKNIEEVKTGDQVAVTDPVNGRATVRKVAGTIVTEEDKKFVDLSITTGDAEKSAALISTVTHPFWVASEDRWVDAGDLKPGMTLRTPSGATVKVQGVRHFERRQRTHDLTVNGIHTYYVLAGATPVLVHNSNCTVYRTQTSHPDSQRLGIDANGSVSLSGEGRLYLNMSGDASHSLQFRGADGQVLGFDVDSSFVARVRESALPQRKPREFAGSTREWNQLRRTRPDIADPSVSPGLYGIPSNMFGDLMGAIVPGSGRVVR